MHCITRMFDNIIVKLIDEIILLNNENRSFEVERPYRPMIYLSQMPSTRSVNYALKQVGLTVIIDFTVLYFPWE